MPLFQIAEGLMVTHTIIAQQGDLWAVQDVRGQPRTTSSLWLLPRTPRRARYASPLEVSVFFCHLFTHVEGKWPYLLKLILHMHHQAFTHQGPPTQMFSLVLSFSQRAPICWNHDQIQHFCTSRFMSDAFICCQRRKQCTLHLSNSKHKVSNVIHKQSYLQHSLFELQSVLQLHTLLSF